ncbi:MAG: hypothetical protein ACI9SC_002636 [Gammaproteobacteria bacterium]|jgi:hypothetical protein
MNTKSSFSTPVKASIETLWSVLKDKAENPGRYVPGFIESEVLEQNADSMLCRLHTDRFDIVERITIDETNHTVYFDLLDHPDVTGLLTNKIEKALSEEGYPILSYAYDWQQRRSGEDADDMSDIVQNALQRAKEFAEQREQEK